MGLKHFQSNKKLLQEIKDTQNLTLEEIQEKMPVEITIHNLRILCNKNEVKFLNPLEKPTVDKYLENQTLYKTMRIQDVKTHMNYPNSVSSLIKILKANGINHKQKKPTTRNFKPKDFDIDKRKLLRVKRPQIFTLSELRAVVNYKGSLENFKTLCEENNINYIK